MSAATRALTAIGEGGGQCQTLLELADGLIKVPLTGGKNAEHVVDLSSGLYVVRLLGQLPALRRQLRARSSWPRLRAARLQSA